MKPRRLALAGAALLACSPTQEQTIARDATAIGPYLEGACTLLEADAPPATLGVVDMVCAGAEAADRVLAKLAAAKVSAATIETTPAQASGADGGAPRMVSLVHIRIQVRADE